MKGVNNILMIAFILPVVKNKIEKKWKVL